MKVGDLVRDIEFGDTGILLSPPRLSEDCKGEVDTYYVANVHWCRIGMTQNNVTDYIEVINETR